VRNYCTSNPARLLRPYWSRMQRQCASFGLRSAPRYFSADTHGSAPGSAAYQIHGLAESSSRASCLAGRALQTFTSRCEVVAVTDAVLTRATRPFPAESIPTLDAIHLATVELLEEPPPLAILW
jgi:hypothetical protein